MSLSIKVPIGEAESRLDSCAGHTYTFDGDGNRVPEPNGNLAASGTLYWDMTPLEG